MSKHVALTLLSCLLLAACTGTASESGTERGTETGNPPVIGFGNSGCHDQAYDKGRVLQSLDPSTPDPLYKGLTCMTWHSAEANRLQIQLTNYESGCGSDLGGWTPRAELRDDGGLDLVLEDDECATAGCGWCLYDLTFTVAVDEPIPNGEVRIYQRGCGEASKQQKRATLALTSQPSGAVCNYAHLAALTWKNGAPGTERTPCNTTAPQGQQCNANLTCTDLGERAAGDFSGGERCLANCTEDSGCDSLSRCEEGVCKLRVGGLLSD